MTNTIPNASLVRLFCTMEIVNQSLERPNKWICSFNRVYAIWFMVDVSKYDVTLQSQTITNYLESNKLVFQKLWQIHMYSEVVLCFTKKDIFNEKICRSHLVDHFPAYTCPKQDPEAALKFITDMFVRSAINMTSANERFKKTIYHIAVSTIDVDSSMQEVFGTLKQNVLEFHILQLGIFNNHNALIFIVHSTGRKTIGVHIILNLRKNINGENYLNAHLYRKTTLVCQAGYDHLSITAKKL